ncbi:MSCRAMM family protein [Oceanithermus sp.]
MKYRRRRRLPVQLLGLLALLAMLPAPAHAAAVRIVRTSPEVRRAVPGKVVTHVFAVYGQGQVKPRFVSEHSWPILSAERPLNLDPQKATYLAVSVRIPPGTPEGVRDRLTVEVGGAREFAYSQAAFQAGLEASWPRTVEFPPPVGYLEVKITNSGNGPDSYLVRLETMNKEPVFSTRVQLEAGQSSELKIPLSGYDTYRMVVASQRSGLKKEGVVVARPAPTRANGAYRLIGRFGATYNYPGSFSVSASLAGPLSDYAYLHFGVGYSLGSLPAGSISLSFEGGYFSVTYGPSYGVALGFQEGITAVSLSMAGPKPRGGINLDFAAGTNSYGFSAILDDKPSFRFDARLNNVFLKCKPDALKATLTFAPAERRLYTDTSYDFHYGNLPLRIAYGTSWQPNKPLMNYVSIDANPHQASIGGRISWNGYGVSDWGLAFASNSERLKIDSPLPFYLGLSAGANRFRAFAGATLDLPQPWSDLSGRVEAELSGGSWSFSVSGSSQASSMEGLTIWDVGGKLGWPLSENQISLGVRAGSSYLRGRASLDWSPWKPLLDTRLGLEMPAGGAMLRATLSHEWYSGKTGFGLSASLPWLVEVPQGAVEFFGGRRAGTVKGVVEVQGPQRFRQGIVVRAGGQTAVTDADGRFELQLKPGEYEVEIDRNRLPAVLVAVKPMEKVTVRLKETVSVRLEVAVRSLLEGRVRVEGENRQAPPRFAVQISDERGRQTSLYTRPDGGFRLEGLPPGMYTVKLLTDLLPPGWKAVKPEATVLLEPGETGLVELVVAAPKRKVYRGGLQILSVKPEAKTVPPGSAPLVSVELKGEAEQVLIEFQKKVVGVLLPGAKAETWTGRVRIPGDYEGPLALQVIARTGDQEARFPFFVSVSKKAPWGLVRTLPVAKRGQELPVAVHWYTPVEECWLEVAGEKVRLNGKSADWSGRFTVPANAGERLQITAAATTQDGRRLEIKRYLLVR